MQIPGATGLSSLGQTSARTKAVPGAVTAGRGICFGHPGWLMHNSQLHARVAQPRGSSSSLLTPEFLENQLPTRKREQRDLDRVNATADARTGE